jgi:hypothetical protein
MSLSSILVPNNLDLFCGSINTTNPNQPSDFAQITIDTDGKVISTPSLIIKNDQATSTGQLVQVVSNSTVVGSRITIQNTNSASTSNGFNSIDNNGVLGMTVGNNNADSTAYLYAGNSKDLKFGAYDSGGTPHEYYRVKNAGNLVFQGASSGFLFPYSFSGTTTDGTTQVVVATIPIALVSAATIEVTCQGYCTAGPQLNLSLSRKFMISAINPGSGTAINGTQTSLFSQNGTGMTGTVTGLAIGNNIQIAVTGVASDTIAWTGVAILYT